MTRRIALAILLTVWAMLIAVEVTAYFSTRAVLLADLDDTLVSRAISLPEVNAAGAASGSAPARDSDDRYIVRSAIDQRTVRAGEPRASVAPSLLHATFVTLADGRRVRTVTVQVIGGAKAKMPMVVTYTGSAEQFHRLLERLAIMLIVCGLGGGAIAAAIAGRVARASLRPLLNTASVVAAIDEHHLDQRIPTAQLPTELAPVAARMNEMLGRLEIAFSRRRQFLADAAHELRTPVAALMTGLEVTLARPRAAEMYRTAAEGALSEARHLRKLVERLMEQVRSETLSHDEPAQTINVSALLDECIARVTPQAEQAGIQIERRYDEQIQLSTQPGRLLSIVTNLLSNAVEYNRAGGSVQVQATRRERGITIQVRDTGPGIAPEHLPNLFQPFYRGDQARRSADPSSDGESGNGHLGLGLYLVQSHLRAIGGACRVHSELGKGSMFELDVPDEPAE